MIEKIKLLKSVPIQSRTSPPKYGRPACPGSPPSRQMMSPVALKAVAISREKIAKTCAKAIEDSIMIAMRADTSYRL